jgi:hypothetical protein
MYIISRVLAVLTFLCSFINFEDLSDILGNSTDYEALEKIWEESLKEIDSRLDRITLHDFKRIMKGRPKEGMTAFIQSSPGLIPTLADSSLIPSMFEELGLSNVMEEDPELMESVNEQAEIEKVANMSSSSIYMNGTFDTKRPTYRGSIWSSTSSTSVDTFVYGSRRSSLPASKSLSSASEMSIDSVLMSPLAANRAIYRKSLLRHSIVSDTQMGSNNNNNNDSNKNDLRNSTTSASLVMKRGTLFPNTTTKSLMAGTKSGDVNTNRNNATIDTLESVVSLDMGVQ